MLPEADLFTKELVNGYFTYHSCHQSFQSFTIAAFLKRVRLVKVVASLNRSMRSLAATMRRRVSSYVLLLAVVVTFGGAAGMYNIERGHPGFENYGMTLWWTAMRVITAGSDYWLITPEGRGLAFILSLFGYGIFGYVTAMLATFFIGRDAEDKSAPLAGAKDIREIAIDIMKIKQCLERIEADVQKG